MAVCSQVHQGASLTSDHWSPICCGRSMFQLMRRMLVLSSGRVLLSSVWNCGQCGRVMQ